MRAANGWRVTAALAVMILIAAACSSSSKSTSSSGTTAGSSSGQLTASYRGVTPDSIKLGYSYPDLDALAKTGLIKVGRGPEEAIVKALVDDINARGGVKGRKLEVVFGKFGVLGANEQLASCTKLTEDEKVFMILGGYIGDNNLCAIQQHKTGVIFNYGAGFNQISLGKAQAPWVTPAAADERSIKALVQILDKQGTLKGKTIGVYGTLSASKPLIDLTSQTLKDAGYEVKDTAINDVDATDAQAFNAQDKVIGNRFKDEGIDTVFVMVTVPPGTNWDAVDFHPTMFSPQSGLVASGSFTNDYTKFPLVASLSLSADPNQGYDTPEMKRCREVWKKASGQDVKPPTQEAAEGKSSGFPALASACVELKVFVAAATAAGPDLTYDSFMKGLSSLGKIELAGVPAASFGPNKPDAQDSFQLVRINPQWKPNTTVQQFLPIGEPITFTG
jgi:hypothetical protein